MENEKIRDVSIGTSLTNNVCALTYSGNVYCWGDNRGQMINAAGGYIRSPQLIDTHIKFRSISLGSDIICGISQSDQPYCWGSRSSEFALGVRRKDQNNNYVMPSDYVRHIPYPVNLENTNNEPIRKIDISSGRSCMLAYSGNVYCWGYVHSNVPGAEGFFPGSGETGYSALGQGTKDAASRPVKVSAPEGENNTIRFQDITVTQYTTCGITFTNEVYCWGSNTDGQGATGSRTPSTLYKPTKALGLEGKNITEIDGKDSTFCGTNNNNDTYCWGYSDVYNLLGYEGDSEGRIYSRSPVPIPVRNGNVTKFRQISPGSVNTCGISATDPTEAVCWGWNFGGQLGIGNQIWSYTKRQQIVINDPTLN